MVCFLTLGRTIFSILLNVSLLYRWAWYYCPSSWGHTGATGGVHQAAKCELPNLDPFDPEMISLLQRVEVSRFECYEDYALVRLVWKSPDGSTLVKPRLELTKSGSAKIADLKCFTRQVTRNEDDQTVTFGDRVEVKRFPVEMTSEFVQFFCEKALTGFRVYTDTFAAIPHIENQGDRKVASQRFNVIIIGLDSVSRANAMRFLPKTFEWLKNRYGTYIFVGYHKIGENSFPNMTPMFTGRQVQLPSFNATPQLPHEVKNNNLHYLTNEFPLIWRRFADIGYVTSFTEEGTLGIFSYMLDGFRQPPAHHYGRPMYLSIEESQGKYLKTSTPTSGPNNKYLGIVSVNGVKTWDKAWDYGIKQLLERYSPNHNVFSFSWLVYATHGEAFTIKYFDEPLLKLLQYLTNETAPWFNNTFVFVASDHGPRFDMSQLLRNGRVEAHFPFFSAITPPSFRQRFPELNEQLAGNTKKLVTSLDIYATYQHILHLSDPERVKLDPGPSGYAKSLFQPIDPLRNCAAAGIPDGYCTCRRTIPLSNATEEAAKAGLTLVQKLNNELFEAVREDFCAELGLAEVQSFRMMEQYDRKQPKCYLLGHVQYPTYQSVDYVVQVKVEPSHGLFEATVRQTTLAGRKGSVWSVVGDIERTNSYGNQSACLPNRHRNVRKMCLCGQ